MNLDILGTGIYECVFTTSKSTVDKSKKVN